MILLRADCIKRMGEMEEDSIDGVCLCDPPYGLEFLSKDEGDGDVLHDPSVVGGFQDGNGGNPYSRARIRYGTKGGPKKDWQAGGGFSKPGIGERQTEWPSFSATSRYGAANPTCAECGGRLRGAKKCSCEQPHDHWKPIGKRRDPENEGLPDTMTGSGMAHHMNAIAEWHSLWLAEVYRVLAPGGVIKAFGGSRVYHRLALAMEAVGFEDIGFESWNYATGFPKSHNVGKVTGPPWLNWGTALKPAWEPVIVGRKPVLCPIPSTGESL